MNGIIKLTLIALLLTACGKKETSAPVLVTPDQGCGPTGFCMDPAKTKFGFPPPSRDDMQYPKTLWATYYNLPIADALDEGFALRDLKGRPLGPLVSRKKWCFAAMEGSVIVKEKDGSQVTYNYAGTSDDHQVDCSAFYNHPPSHRVKFTRARGQYGDGVRNYLLVPFRSIAVDRRFFPYGSVFYIPAARGVEIPLPNGQKMIHDGYFFAADTGGLIKTNHIDVYIGIETKSPFSFIRSNPNKTFRAYVISDGPIKDYLEKIHLEEN